MRKVITFLENIRTTTITEAGKSAIDLNYETQSNGLSVSWLMRMAGWSRLELQSSSQDDFSSSHVRLQIELKGVPFSTLEAIYFLHRDVRDGTETAYLVANNFQFTGAYDCINVVIAIKENISSLAAWSIGFQNSDQLQITILKCFAVFTSQPDILAFWPGSKPFRLLKANESNQNAVSIVLCIHNSWSTSQTCLKSVFAHRRPGDQLIIVNDGSTEEVGEQIRSLINSETNVIYIEDRTGSGYTKAVNRGILYSKERILILLNSDTIVPSGWVERLIAPFEQDPRVGIVGPLSNRATLQSMPAMLEGEGWARNDIITPNNFENADHTIFLISEKIQDRFCEVDLVNGFCLAVRRELIDEIGFFDELVFATGYGEETDFEMRARSAGWRCGIVINLLVYHHGSASYESYDLKRYQDVAFSCVTMKHGPEILQERYVRSRQILADLKQREILSIVLRSQKFILETNKSVLEEDKKLNKITQLLDILV